MADNKLTFFDKLKLLLWLNSVSKEMSKMDKIKGLLGKLDGLKSVLGLLMVTAYYVAPQFKFPLPDVVLHIGSGLAGVGIAAKLEKGAGLLSKAIDVAHKVLDVTKNVVDAVAPKPPEAPKA